jgi:hypothetical protein
MSAILEHAVLIMVKNTITKLIGMENNVLQLIHHISSRFKITVISFNAKMKHY